jgi:ribosomal protein L11 methyltransferase
MKYREISVFTTEAGLDAVCARFSMLGMEQLEIVQGREEIADFLQKSAKYWDFADMDELCAGEPCVKAYIDDDEEADATIASLKASLAELKTMQLGFDIGSLNTVVQTVDDSVWLNAWKEAYKPFPVGKRLLVRPSWEDDFDADGRSVLSLDPGMAFGTGSHPTTRMCLEYIDDFVKDGDSVVDLGCGSGILSIAALILGAKDAIAVDIDPIAETIAYENAALNGIGKDRYTVLTGDVLTDSALRSKIESKRYPIVTANIVASVIIALAPYAAKLLEDGGKFITSGIIDSREEEVAAALTAAGLNIIEIRRGGDWRAILAEKRA